MCSTQRGSAGATAGGGLVKMNMYIYKSGGGCAY